MIGMNDYFSHCMVCGLCLTIAHTESLNKSWLNSISYMKIEIAEKFNIL